MQTARLFTIQKLPELRLTSCVDLDASLEWPVSRDALLEVSPDREDLFMGAESMEDIRESLKLSSDAGYVLVSPMPDLTF